MFLQAWVVDLLDRGVCLEPARHLHGILRLSAHTVRESVQAAKGQPAIERRGHRTSIALRLAGPFKQIILVPGDERAADYVAVAANILGRRVGHHIEPAIERSLRLSEERPV